MEKSYEEMSTEGSVAARLAIIFFMKTSIHSAVACRWFDIHLIIFCRIKSSRFFFQNVFHFHDASHHPVKQNFQ